MQDTLTYHITTISTGGRRIINLRFAVYLYLIAGSSNELKKLTDSLAKNASRYGM